MFDTSIYTKRRRILRNRIHNGLILLLSNDESPMNYPSNPYHYRQDSTFLYYIGLDEPNVYAIIDLDDDTEIIFGDELSIDDIIWIGSQPKLLEKAKKVGINKILPLSKFDTYLKESIKLNKKIHYLPPYRNEHYVKISKWLQIEPEQITINASVDLTKAVIDQRSVKSEEEINEIENAHSITYNMHTTAMKMAKPNILEREIAGTIEGIALSMGASVSFPVILSVRGEILHNHHHGNRMQDGDLLINDSGAESELHYAADITRTIPVSSKFSEKQKTIYNIVLNSQMAAIEAIKPGIKYLDIHKQTALIIANGLKEIGLMKGDMAEAIEQGAHALFFPHGLGHMLGLDVHDMENLGEDLVGYDETIKRSNQFGLTYLRLAKELKEGYVLTVEPGIYFIPQLIDLWESENKFSSFIDYKKVKTYRDFGGIRIEDNVLVTATRHRVIGKTIPKTINDVEVMCCQ